MYVSLNTRTFDYVIIVLLSEQEIKIDVVLSFINLIQILYIVPLMSFIVRQKNIFSLAHDLIQDHMGTFSCHICIVPFKDYRQFILYDPSVRVSLLFPHEYVNVLHLGWEYHGCDAVSYSLYHIGKHPISLSHYW